MRVISTRTHGVLDYLTGATLLSAPSLLGLTDVPASAQVFRLAGAARCSTACSPTTSSAS